MRIDLDSRVGGRFEAVRDNRMRCPDRKFVSEIATRKISWGNNYRQRTDTDTVSVHALGSSDQFCNDLFFEPNEFCLGKSE
jgi:hypothetical protein